MVSIVDGMPEADYFAHPALSASGMKSLLKAPALFQWERENGSADTKATDDGSVFHRLVLGAGSPVTVVDASSWQTKAAKEAQAAARAVGGVPILRRDLRHVARMATSLRRHPEFAPLFTDGHAEQSVFWTDADTGIDLRCRVDYVLPDAALVDLKSAVDGSPDGFGRACVNFGYDLSAAVYVDGWEAVTGQRLPYIFVVVEKSAPFLVSAYQATHEALERGRRRYREALDIYRACTESGVWPGYSPHIEPVRLPAWAA